MNRSMQMLKLSNICMVTLHIATYLWGLMTSSSLSSSSGLLGYKEPDLDTFPSDSPRPPLWGQTVLERWGILSSMVALSNIERLSPLQICLHD